MPDPANENEGATAPESPPPGEAPEAPTQATPPSEAPTQAVPAAEAAPAQGQVAAAAEQPTAQVPPAPAAAAATPPSGPWYRRRWALITGAVAAAAILFLGGMAVASAVWGDDGPDGHRGDGAPGMYRDGDRGRGQDGWGGNGNGMVPPGMGQGGQGRGDGGDRYDGGGWDRDGEGYGHRGYGDPDDLPAGAAARPCYAVAMAERAQTILVIEDDPAVGEALVEGIGTEGYQVHWETTGSGGVAFARDHSPQLIVLDVRLPDGNGFDFCRRMRTLGLRQPILMLTVQSDQMDWAPTTTSPSPTTCASSSRASAPCSAGPTASSPPPRRTSCTPATSPSTARAPRSPATAAR